MTMPDIAAMLRRDVGTTTCPKCGDEYTVDHCGCPQCAITMYRTNIAKLEKLTEVDDITIRGLFEEIKWLREELTRVRAQENERCAQIADYCHKEAILWLTARRIRESLAIPQDPEGKTP